MKMKIRDFQISNKCVGTEHPPFIIAELSANHKGDIELVKKLMEVATDCGADAIKIQSYNADTMTIKSDNSDFIVKHGVWKGRSLYELYEKAQTPFKWHEELFSFAKKKNIILFSTPFDESAVELLTKVGVPAFKIASFENTFHHLIKKVSQTKKLLIIYNVISSKKEIL